MKNEKLEEIIRKENLEPVCYNEKDLHEDTVYFIKTFDGYSVFTTGERAEPVGKIKNFKDENEAINNALIRLRAKKFQELTTKGKLPIIFSEKEKIKDALYMIEKNGEILVYKTNEKVETDGEISNFTNFCEAVHEIIKRMLIYK